MTDQEQLANFVKTQTQYILLHKLPTNEDPIFFVLLYKDTTFEHFKDFGKSVIGLDSVHKWTNLQIPVWLVTAETPAGTGFTGAVLVTNDATHSTLQHCLKHIIDKFPNNPTVMIDHDSTYFTYNLLVEIHSL